MPAKAPIYLKPTNSKKGKKCRLRDILSPDMISPPLGDFRHTIHIGRGGERDAFGDMSFLQGKFELLPGKMPVHPHHGNQSEYLRAHSTGDASFAETPSPVLKNAISLPTIGGSQALTLPLMPAAVFPTRPLPLGDFTGPSPPLKADSPDELEILQMDALLRSMEVFDGEPPSPFADLPSKPGVLLGLLEGAGEYAGGLREANGSLDSRASSDSCDSFDNKDDFRNDGRDHRHGELSGGFGRFTKDISLSFKQELSRCNKDWVDRDSGVEEGRISDFEFELSKEKGGSQESLAQVTGSLLSLELDLGPSILDDVLNIMDRPAAKSRP